VPDRPSTHWPTVVQFAFSGLVALALFSMGLAVGLSALIGQLSGSLLLAQGSPLLVRAAGLLFCGLLVLPSAGLALLRILGKPLPSRIFPAPPEGTLRRRILRRDYLLPGLALVWVLALLASFGATRVPQLEALLLPVLVVLVVALPIAGFVAIGSSGLPAGSLQRRWGIFTASLAGSTLVVILVELLLIAAIVAGGVILIASRPEWASAVERLAQRIANSQITPENLGRILRPYLTQPWVIYLVLAFYSGLVPLIEEALKPLPLWFMARWGLSPAEGFTGGLIAGAAFALFESLGVQGVSGESGWIGISIARVGTDLIHILNTGLMGWALASAWKGGKFLRLALTYLGVVAIHGLWNAFSLALGLLPLVSPGSTWLQALENARAAQAALGILFLVSLVILLRVHRRLRTRPPQTESGTLAETAGTPGS
jgi:hypothetical protein